MGRKVQAIMRRAPDGSAFIPCESCKAKVPVAVADMHSCSDDAAFKASLAKMKEDYAKRLSESRVAEEATKVAKAAKASTKSASRKKSGDDTKNANAPKKPPTAFMVFMDEFRKQYKEEHPDNKKVTEVAKAGGEKWKSMSEEAKAEYVKEANERKEKYNESLHSSPNADTGTAKDEGDKDDLEAEGEEENEDPSSEEADAPDTKTEDPSLSKCSKETDSKPDQKRRRLVKAAKEEEADDTLGLEDDIQD